MSPSSAVHGGQSVWYHLVCYDTRRVDIAVGIRVWQNVGFKKLMVLNQLVPVQQCTLLFCSTVHCTAVAHTGIIIICTRSDEVHEQFVDHITAAAGSRPALTVPTIKRSAWERQTITIIFILYNIRWQLSVAHLHYYCSFTRRRCTGRSIHVSTVWYIFYGVPPGTPVKDSVRCTDTTTGIARANACVLARIASFKQWKQNNTIHTITINSRKVRLTDLTGTRTVPVV